MNQVMNQPTGNLQIVEAGHDGARSYFITAQATEQSFREVFNRVKKEVEARDARIAFQYLFGGRRFYPQVASAIEKTEWPLTLLQGDSCYGCID